MSMKLTQSTFKVHKSQLCATRRQKKGLCMNLVKSTRCKHQQSFQFDFTQLQKRPQTPSPDDTMYQIKVFTISFHIILEKKSRKKSCSPSRDKKKMIQKDIRKMN